MKSFKGLLKTLTENDQKRGKTVVFTFGRFQPPTKGHQVVFDKVRELADSMGAEHRIYSSRSGPQIMSDPNSKYSPNKREEIAVQNPLHPDDKHKLLTSMFPAHNFINHPSIRTSFDAWKHLAQDGVEHAVFVGEEGRREIVDSMQKYIGHPDFPNIKTAKFEKSGERDPDSEGVEGISGTRAREVAMSGDHKSFHSMLPDGIDPELSREMMEKIRTSTNRSRIAADQLRQKKKTKKEEVEHDDSDEDVMFFSEEKDKTRKERDHRMYGWDKAKPSAKQLANRKRKNHRTSARRKANESGRTKKGDKSVELDHVNGNPNDNSSDNLRVVSRKFNRSRNNNKRRK